MGIWVNLTIIFCLNLAVCSTVLLPSRIVQVLNLNVDNMSSHPPLPSSFVHSAAHAGKPSPLFKSVLHVVECRAKPSCLWPLLLKQNTFLCCLHTANEKLHLDLMKKLHLVHACRSLNLDACIANYTSSWQQSFEAIKTIIWRRLASSILWKGLPLCSAAECWTRAQSPLRVDILSKNVMILSLWRLFGYGF